MNAEKHHVVSGMRRWCTCQTRVDDKRSSNRSDAGLGGVFPRDLQEGLNIAPLERRYSWGSSGIWRWSGVIIICGKLVSWCCVHSYSVLTLTRPVASIRCQKIGIIAWWKIGQHDCLCWNWGCYIMSIIYMVHESCNSCSEFESIFWIHHVL